MSPFREQPVIYPGTFDPVTLGHLDVIERAMRVFPRVIIAVAHNPFKKPLFSVAERVELIRACFPDPAARPDIEDFNGLLLDYARDKNARIVIRGLRAVSDFEFEFQMALSQRKIDPLFETLFLMPSEEFSFVSSKIIKEIAALGGDVSKFVPPHVARKLREKFSGA